MSSVAAVIPSWNTAKYLERCLDSLSGQDVEVEVMVIDNGSEDDSVELLSRIGVPHLTLARNVGFATAINLGVARTTAPLLLVLNADCFLAPASLGPLVQELGTDDRLGGVQPRILQEREKDEVARIYSTGQFLSRFGAAFERGWGEPDGPRFDDGGPVFGVCGAACLLRREMFTALDGYDTSYFAFFEDVDLNARARLAGWKFAYVPEAIAVHVGHAAWRQAARPHAFNVQLTVRNRLATAVKVLPARGVAGAAALTVRSLLASPFRGTGRAALAGAAAAVRWLPRLLAERRRLRAGSPSLLDEWLTRAPGRGPDPGESARASSS
jgi:N-acetylglucosaminyl-diphospho-decaprenol L-rhamnosyltransferase